MGIALGTVKARDLSERLLPRQRGAIMGCEEVLDGLGRRRVGVFAVYN
jgi:hypothetical protein